MSGALAFLGPFFTMFETVTAAIDVLNAVPKVVTKPQEITDALAKLAKAATKLASLAPQFSVPPLVRGVLQTIALSFRAFADELGAIASKEQKLDEAQALADELELDELKAAVSCARGEVAAAKKNLAASFGPINKLLAFVEGIAQLLPVPVDIPSLEAPTGAATEAIVLLNQTADALEQLAAAIPG